MITAEVAGEITLKLDEVPREVVELVKSALSVPNERREVELRERVFGAWDLPEVIPLWREEVRRSGDRVLCLPRGFAYGLLEICRGLDVAISFDDRRTKVQAEPGYFRMVVPRDYQAEATRALLSQEQGVYECPAGGGKSWTAFALMWLTQQRSIVVVDSAYLLNQWRARANEAFGLSLDLGDERSVGHIGEGVWEERDLTIALRQTLWSRLWQVDAVDWFSRYGLVGWDECHHLASETNGEICRRAGCYYSFGFSATPAKSPARGMIVTALVGPTVFRETRARLYDRDVLVRPRVRQIKTELEADFWPTHDAIKDEGGVYRCEMPGCRKKGAHGHRNNYSSVLKGLVEDVERNALIGRMVVAERGHVHLIQSGQLKHLDLLRKACEDAGWDGPIFMLRGEENQLGLSQEISHAIHSGGHWETYEAKEGRKKVTRLRQVAEVGPHGREALVFATIAGEGLDIPPIDRTWITFPMRQEAALIQLVGRGERKDPGKVDSVINDVVDYGCLAFAEQARERERVYRKEGFRIEVVE